jgi:beta-mannosidase
VLLCGNNEISEAWHNWGWQKQFHLSASDSTEIWNGYKKLFEDVIPKGIYEIDSAILYWPSSPLHGWGRSASMKEGDSHYWGVWWGMQPFEIYAQKVGRFMSEYGFQGMPSVNTFRKFTTGALEIEASAVKAHQKHPKGYKTIEQYRSQWYSTPKDFENYVYQSQLLQAEGMKLAIEAHRREMPVCMGSLYWQLNDCLPVTSLISIDYYHKKKAAHYFIKKAFSENLISVKKFEHSYDVYFVSDDSLSKNLEMTIKVLDFNGNVLLSQKQEFKSMRGSQVVVSMDSLQLKSIHTDFSSSVLVAFVNDETTEVSRSYYYFLKPLHLRLTKPSVRIEVSGKNQLRVSSATLVKNLYLQAEGVEFSDNFFDILPGEPVYVQVRSLKSLQKVIESITTTSLYESSH